MTFSIRELSHFSSGMMSLQQFRERVITEVLAAEPQVETTPDGSSSATFSLMSEWATYLEMVTDPDDPSFAESESRRLAGAMCAILKQVPDNNLRRLVSPYARWAHETATAIRKRCGGEMSADAFGRFVSRRPWPDGHKKAILAFHVDELSSFGEALRSNDYHALVAMLEG